MHKNATKCNETLSKWCKNKHGASKIMVTLETYQSPISISDKDYDFSLDLSYISIVEKEPFCGTENESAMGHMNELSSLSNLFSVILSCVLTLLPRFSLFH
jgi:hypothetical protein